MQGVGHRGGPSAADPAPRRAIGASLWPHEQRQLAAFYRRYNSCCNEHSFEDLAEFVARDVAIEGEIRRYFRDYTWAVRVPRDLQDRAVRLERDRDALSEELGRAPTAQELADWSRCTVEEIVDALEATDARAGDSFDRPMGGDDDEGRTLAERLGASDDGYEAAEARLKEGHLIRGAP